MRQPRVTEEWDLRIIDDPWFLSLPGDSQEEEELGGRAQRPSGGYIPLDLVSAEEVASRFRGVGHNTLYGARDPLEILLRREERRARRKHGRR